MISEVPFAPASCGANLPWIFESALEALLDFLPDPEVLSLAALQGRILVSHDENTMPAHFNRLLESGSHSPGLLIVPQGAPVGPVIEGILLIWIATDAEEWTDRIAWLPL